MRKWHHEFEIWIEHPNGTTYVIARTQTREEAEEVQMRLQQDATYKFFVVQRY